MNHLNLLMNENMKIYCRPRTWVIIGILLAIVVTGGLILSSENPEYGNDQWKEKVKNEIQAYKHSINVVIENPTEATKLRFHKGITRLQYYLDHDISPYNKNGFIFAKEAVPELSFVISLFTIIIAGSIVASEFTWGTIKLLLIRPHPRWSILLSKYMAATIFSIFLYVLLFVFCWLIGGLTYGFDGISYPIFSVTDEGQVIKEMAGVSVLKSFSLQFIKTFMIMTIVFMLSTVFRSGSVAIGLGVFMLFFGNLLRSMISFENEWGKYLLFPNLDLTYYLSHSGGPIQGMTFSFSVVMNLVYWLGCVILTWIVFQKRDVAD